MDISVVILNWNDIQHLMVCLESLIECTIKRTIEIMYLITG